ncbi:AAA family ATPase [Paenibacillus medicaginis]|uniref:ATP/GTP-binding protein n=1 Tax=Paenibacillus medicaginis TaxID=1470560 RepID=A0ABV5BYJ1_9BACL
MSFINEVNIRGFRGIKQLNLPHLSQINLFVGQNNSGKTSLLEALELSCRPLDITQLVITSKSRDRVWNGPIRMPTIESVIWMFPHISNEKDEAREIFIESQVNEVKRTYKVSCTEQQVLQSISRVTRSKATNIDEVSEEEVRALSIKMEYNDEESKREYSEEFILTDQFRFVRDKNIEIKILKHRMVTPIDHRVQPISARHLTRSIMSGEKNDIIELLQKFDKNIEGIEVLSPDGRSPVPFFKHKLMGYAPVSVFGDGVRRVLTIATAVLQCKDGILLIDEIETAVHTKLFEKFFDWLVSLCEEYNVQLFATTHSLETIDAILSAEKNNLEKLIAYRLETNDDYTDAKKFVGQDLYDIRYELGQDVR